MKRLLFLLLAGLVTFGCSEEYDAERAQYPSFSMYLLSVWPLEVNCDYHVQNVDLSITSDNTPWSIQNDVDWISMNLNSGNDKSYVPVSIQENKKSETRVGLFYVNSEVSEFPVRIPVTVTQGGAIPYINLPMTTVTLDTQNPTYTLEVESNCEWEYQYSASWLQITKNGNTLVLTATEDNMNTISRSASLTIKYVGSTNSYYSLIVKQLPTTVSVSTEEIKVPAGGGVYDVTFSCKGKWKIMNLDSYISVTPSSGEAGEHTVKVEVAPSTSKSSRSSSFTIYVDDIARQSVKIMQNGYVLSLSQTSLYFDPMGETKKVTVTSTSNWLATTGDKWISLDPSKGATGESFNVTTQPNESSTLRRGTVGVMISGTTIEATLSVGQYANSQELGRTWLNFGAASSSQIVKVTSATGWKAKANDSWITVTPTESTTKNEFTVTVAANTSADERKGTVEVTMGDKVATLEVVQEGTILELSGSLSYTSKGGNSSFSLTANGAWELSVEDNADWITLGETSGEGSKDISILCADNPSMNERNSAILVKNDVGQTLRLPVTQAGRYLRVDHTELLFFASGGTSESVTIETDGKFKVSSSYMWLDVNTVGNTFTVTCTPNEGDKPRTGKIIVELTDLKSGSYQIELTVTQLEPGGSFQLIDYGNDENYDSQGSQSMTVNLTPYAADSNYDGGFAASSLSVRKISSQLKAVPVMPLIKQIDK